MTQSKNPYAEILVQRKDLGQNFLKDRMIAKRIVSTIPSDTSRVLEIGPGSGILTDEIISKGFDLTCIELDGRFAGQLRDRYRDQNRVRIIEDDILRYISREHLLQGSYVISNLPFNISSDLVIAILDILPYPFEDGYGFGGATIMFQKEYALRLLAGVGTKDYGRLTVSFGSKLDAVPLMDVNRNCFDPAPSVDATVLKINEKNGIPRKMKDKELFEFILRESFSRRRKKMKNSSGPLSSRGIDPDLAVRAMVSLSLDQKRPQELSLDDFIDLADMISDTVSGKG